MGNNDWHAIGVPCVIAVRLNAGAHCGSKTFLGRSCNAVQGPLPSEIAGIDHGSRGLEGWTMTFSYDEVVHEPYADVAQESANVMRAPCEI